MDRILGYSFHRLVQEKGWVAFRELEYSICKRLARRERVLICLGGGTVRYEWNMDVLRGSGFCLKIGQGRLQLEPVLPSQLDVAAGLHQKQDFNRINGRILDEFDKPRDERSPRRLP